jgi:hypothetical protein
LVRLLKTTAVPAARGMVTVSGVRVRCLKGKDWRRTEVLGPSTIAWDEKWG